MMDVGSIVICITIGAIICFVFFSAGVIYGRLDKGQLNNDSDIRVYIPMRYRDRSRDQRDNKPMDEEMMLVLQNVKRVTRGREREIMDAIEDDIKTRASRDVIS